MKSRKSLMRAFWCLPDRDMQQPRQQCWQRPQVYPRHLYFIILKVRKNFISVFLDGASKRWYLKLAAELADEKKVSDDGYWKDFYAKKSEYLNMIRYGIEKQYD
jgi:hypothetical protein